MPSLAQASNFPAESVLAYQGLMGWLMNPTEGGVTLILAEMEKKDALTVERVRLVFEAEGDKP